MTTIINPNAMITLYAPLPSDATKMVPLQLPLDPSTQGVRRFTVEELGLAIWVLTATAIGLSQQVDRLERLVAQLVGTEPPNDGSAVLEHLALAKALGADVRARREMEAKAAAEHAAAGGVM